MDTTFKITATAYIGAEQLIQNFDEFELAQNIYMHLFHEMLTNENAILEGEIKLVRIVDGEETVVLETTPTTRNETRQKALYARGLQMMEAITRRRAQGLPDNFDRG